MQLLVKAPMFYHQYAVRLLLGPYRTERLDHSRVSMLLGCYGDDEDGLVCPSVFKSFDSGQTARVLETKETAKEANIGLGDVFLLTTYLAFESQVVYEVCTQYGASRLVAG